MISPPHIKGKSELSEEDQASFYKNSSQNESQLDTKSESQMETKSESVNEKDMTYQFLKKQNEDIGAIIKGVEQQIKQIQQEQLNEKKKLKQEQLEAQRLQKEMQEQELDRKNLKMVQQQIKFKNRNGFVQSIANVIYVKKNIEPEDSDFRGEIDQYKGEIQEIYEQNQHLLLQIDHYQKRNDLTEQDIQNKQQLISKISRDKQHLQDLQKLIKEQKNSYISQINSMASQENLKNTIYNKILQQRSVKEQLKQEFKQLKKEQIIDKNSMGSQNTNASTNNSAHKKSFQIFSQNIKLDDVLQKFQILKTEKSVFDLSEVINGMDVQNEQVECNVDEYK